MTEPAQTLINSRNSAGGQLRTILHVGVANVAPYAASARQALALAAGAHETLTGSAPDDPEYTCGLALIEAASAFVSACVAAQPIIGSPNNWRPKGSDIDVALHELNL